MSVKQWAALRELFSLPQLPILPDKILLHLWNKKRDIQNYTDITYLKYIIQIHCFFIFSQLFFLHCITKNLRQRKKFLVEFMNRLLYNTVHQLQIFGENCVWSSGLLSGAESFSSDIPRKSTVWLTSICSTIWEEVDGTLSLTTQYRNVPILRWHIICKRCVNQLPLLNTCSFSFP